MPGSEKSERHTQTSKFWHKRHEFALRPEKEPWYNLYRQEKLRGGGIVKKRKGLIRLLVLVLALALALAVGWAGDVWQFETVQINLDLSLRAIVRLAVMILGTLTAASLLNLLLGLAKPKSHRGQTVVTLCRSLVQYAAALLILCWGLSILGVNVTTIVASVGILALIVGFGAESLIADVITGLFMLFENRCNVGDIVEVGGFRGTVQRIGIRTTCVVDAGGNVKIINNSEMKNILNRSDKASFAVCDIGIPYETNLPKLEERLPELMEAVFAAHPEAMRAAPNYLGVQSLDSSAVVLRFVAEVSEEKIYSTQRLLNRELLLGFRRLGVECPFPQVDVHTR